MSTLLKTSEIIKMMRDQNNNSNNSNNSYGFLIKDHNRIGSSMLNHIQFNLNILNKNNQINNIEEKMLKASEKTIIYIQRFVSDIRLTKARFLDRNITFNDINQKIFIDNNWNNKLTIEFLEKINNTETYYKLVFNTFMSIFSFRMLLIKDDVIGSKVFDNLFIYSCIIFSFEINNDDTFPTNNQFYEVTKALAILSNEKNLFKIEYINDALREINSSIQFNINNRTLYYFQNKCYGINTPDFKKSNNNNIDNNNIENTTNNTNLNNNDDNNSDEN